MLAPMDLIGFPPQGPRFAPGRRALLDRPSPPFDFIHGEAMSFIAAPALRDWVAAAFIQPGGALYNGEHAHLESATLGFLWANGLNEAAGRRVIGQCELVAQGVRKTWAGQRQALLLRRLFGHLPDFVITIDAEQAQSLSDRQFCALIEHELCHAGQALDEGGAPRFTKQGRPVFAMRPHDIEEFTSVARRYGAWSPALQAFSAALASAPEISDGRLWEACGTCRGRVRAA